MIIDSTYFDDTTPNAVYTWLNTARVFKQRIRVFYGDPIQGICWNEEFDTIGIVGRSTGTKKIPLLLKSKNSIGGSAILDKCIVRIDIKGENNKICTVYHNPMVKFDKFISTDLGNVYNESRDQLYARCKNKEAGEKLAAFMNGLRWGK